MAKKTIGCINVTKNGSSINEDEKRRLKNLFLILFIPGFVMVDAWFCLILARAIIAGEMSTPYVEFIAVYISWVLLIVGIILMVLGLYMHRQRKNIC